MATRKVSAPFKYKLRTKTMTTDYEGSLYEGLQYAFYGIPTTEKRKELIEELKRIDEKLNQLPKEQSDGN